MPTTLFFFSNVDNQTNIYIYIYIYISITILWPTRFVNTFKKQNKIARIINIIKTCKYYIS
jgi:hypothetical protein